MRTYIVFYFKYITSSEKLAVPITAQSRTEAGDKFVQEFPDYTIAYIM